MGLDARDCRVSLGFRLGDDNAIPDDVHWDWSLRDKTCVWLDFIDNGFSPCRSADVVYTDGATFDTSVDYADQINAIVVADNTEFVACHTIPTVSARKIDNNDLEVNVCDPVVTVCDKITRISAPKMSSNTITVEPQNEIINTCVRENKTSAPRKNTIIIDGSV
jgi:hypothetical protein